MLVKQIKNLLCASLKQALTNAERCSDRRPRRKVRSAEGVADIQLLETRKLMSAHAVTVPVVNLAEMNQSNAHATGSVQHTTANVTTNNLIPVLTQVQGPSAHSSDLATTNPQTTPATTGSAGTAGPLVNHLSTHLVSSPGSASLSPGVGMPMHVQLTATSNSTADMTWNSVFGASGYRLYEIMGNQWTLKYSVNSSTTTFHWMGMTPGMTYSFYVQAYDSTSWANSSAASITMPKSYTIAAPQNVHLTATSSTTADMTWNAVSGASGYRLYEWMGNQWTYKYAVNSSTTTFHWMGMNPGKTYTFYVQAYDSTSWHNSASASITMPTTTITAPTLTVQKLGTDLFQLSWNSVNGTQGYRVYYATVYGQMLWDTYSASTHSIIVHRSTNFMVEAYNGSMTADSKWVRAVN